MTTIVEWVRMCHTGSELTGDIPDWHTVSWPLLWNGSGFVILGQSWPGMTQTDTLCYDQYCGMGQDASYWVRVDRGWPRLTHCVMTSIVRWVRMRHTGSELTGDNPHWPHVSWSLLWDGSGCNILGQSSGGSRRGAQVSQSGGGRGTSRGACGTSRVLLRISYYIVNV